MSTPLQQGDPPTLGPFRLQARLQAGPAGIVYLGSDQQGRHVSLALLTRGAATDPAARERFVTAIRASGDGGKERAGAVVAADPDGTAPWVATVYMPRGGGAERFLEPVLMRNSATATAMRGPDFRPHWVGAPEPAVPGLANTWGGGPGEAGSGSGGNASTARVIAGVVILVVILLLVLLLLLLLLFNQASGDPRSHRTEPRPPTTVQPSPSSGSGTKPKNPSPGDSNLPVATNPETFPAKVAPPEPTEPRP